MLEVLITATEFMCIALVVFGSGLLITDWPIQPWTATPHPRSYGWRNSRPHNRKSQEAKP